MPTKKLTTKQAWRKVAEKLSDPTHKFDGLCAEVEELEDGYLDYLTYRKMRDTIYLHNSEYNPGFPWGYVYPAGKEREARILAALFFAEGA